MSKNAGLYFYYQEVQTPGGSLQDVVESPRWWCHNDEASLLNRASKGFEMI